MSIPRMLALLLLALLFEPFALHAQELLRPHPLSPEWTRRQPLNKALQELAGDNAEHCGCVPVGHDPQSWSDCAQKAFREKRAFYVRYDLDPPLNVPPEVEGAFGLASDGSGLVYQAEYWTEWWTYWLQPTELITNHNLQRLLAPTRVSIRLCPSPVRLRVTGHGALTCFSSEPLAETPRSPFPMEF